MTEKDLIGKGVVGMKDGAKVGVVKDLIFQALQLQGLVIRGEHGEGILPFSSISAVGPDAITIESYEVVNWNAGKLLEPNGTVLADLRKLSVVDGSGAKLGQLHDLILEASGQIQQLDVRTEGVFGIGAHQTVIPASAIRALGPNLITVDSVTAPTQTT